MEATHVSNRLPCIISEELIFNPNTFINISGIKQNIIGIWDKYKRTFADPSDLHNEEAMGSIFEGTGLT